MIPAGRGWMGCALLAVSFLGGCASLPPPREAGQPVSHETRDELVGRLQVHQEQIRSLRGIAAVEIAVSEETRRFREALALKSDGRFRLETLNAFGLPVLIVASDGNRVVAHGASEPVGSPDGCELLERLLGLRLSPATLVRLLAGLPPRRVGPPSSRRTCQGGGCISSNRKTPIGCSVSTWTSPGHSWAEKSGRGDAASLSISHRSAMSMGSLCRCALRSRRPAGLCA